MECVRLLHEEDLAAGHGEVDLPYALAKKYPHASPEPILAIPLFKFMIGSCFVATIGYVETQVPMDGVDQSFADWLPPLPAARASTDGVTNRVRDHGVHRFALPTLPNQAIQASVSDAISPRAAFGVHQMTAPPNGWNETIRSRGVTVTARSG